MTTKPVRKGPAGDVRAWDVRTGKLVWTFHTVPRPGEKGHESWTGDTWKDVAGGDVWSFFTIDEKRGILYMPVGSVNNDHYGVDRPGPDLFANSLVAVDVKTGKLKWYFQAIHHDLWDYDMPAAPMLFDVVHHGERIPAVAVITKNPLLFILNRVTGKPIYGAEERPVPAGDAPGEWYSPTQPFPLKPPPLSRLTFTENDFAKITPATRGRLPRVVCEISAAWWSTQQRPVYAVVCRMELSNFPIIGAEPGCGAEPSIPQLGYYIINTTDSGALHFIQDQPNPKPAPLYADPDGQSPILYSTQAKHGPVRDLVFGVLIFGQRLALLGSALGPAYGGGRKYRRHCLADTVRHHERDSGGNQDRSTELSRGSYDHCGRPHLHDRYPRSIFSGFGNQDRQRVVVVQNGPGSFGGSHCLCRQERKGICRGRSRRKPGRVRVGRENAVREHPGILHVQTHLPEGNGRELVQKVCNSCHSVDLITTHRQTRDEWTGTVQRMAQHGASATDEQFNQIVDYLTNNFGRNPDPKE